MLSIQASMQATGSPSMGTLLGISTPQGDACFSDVIIRLFSGVAVFTKNSALQPSVTAGLFNQSVVRVGEKIQRGIDSGAFALFEPGSPWQVDEPQLNVSTLSTFESSQSTAPPVVEVLVVALVAP